MTWNPITLRRMLAEQKRATEAKEKELALSIGKLAVAAAEIARMKQPRGPGGSFGEEVMGVFISCYVDDRTLAVLQREAISRGRTVESLAEAAIESEAIACLPGGMRNMHWGDRVDLGGASIGLRENADGSIRIIP